MIDYAAMNVAPAGGSALRSALVALPDGVKVRGSGRHESPWRTLVLGDTPGDLIESTLVLNLNDPCAICRRDTSWIKPGKYVGVWWEIHKGKSEWSTATALPHGATTENVKHYIDFAAAHDIPYVLAEGWNEGWATQYTTQDFLTPTPDFDLEEVVAYAKSKGVDWIAHNETGGNVTNYENQIEQAYSLYERLGVPGLKTGYAGGTSIGGVEHNHYDQAMVNHYRDTIRRAARHHLIMEAHEMVKDTGERRTYPNIMTREAVRGMEWEAWSEGNPPEHLVEIPFTRMIAGPMSYTPGIFDVTWDPGGPGRPPWRTLERTRVLMEQETLSFPEALELVAASNVFTTHTPVPAGNDAFHPDIIQRYLGSYYPKLGLTKEQFFDLGTQGLPFDIAGDRQDCAAWANAGLMEMAKRGSEYEQIVGSIRRALDPGATVEVGKWVKGPDGRRDRDVRVRGTRHRGWLLDRARLSIPGGEIARSTVSGRPHQPSR